jgi:dihydrofolate reductase
MIISLVAAAAENNAIGKDNQLLWHLPKDMRFFKNRTWAMPVIMGRKTFESLASKALNGRMNIVITKQMDWSCKGVTVAHSLEESYALAAAAHYKKCYVIGGADIYAQSLKDAHFIYLTRVETKLEGDRFFPALDQSWQLISDEAFAADAKHAYPFRFQVWKKA